LAFSLYLVAFVSIGWALLISPINASVASGERERATILIASWLVWTVLVAVLVYGSVKMWRWVFWAYLLLLAAQIVLAIRGPNTSTDAMMSDLIAGLISTVLLTASIVGLVRFGPRAMKTEPAAHD